MVNKTYLHPYHALRQSVAVFQRISKISLKRQRKNVLYNISYGKRFSQGDAIEKGGGFASILSGCVDFSYNTSYAISKVECSVIAQDKMEI